MKIEFISYITLLRLTIGCPFKFILEVEESIVNAPLVSLQSKNTNDTNSEVRFKQLIRDR
jgi:hypothetical protein